jgi:hypothetical protein
VRISYTHKHVCSSTYVGLHYVRLSAQVHQASNKNSDAYMFVACVNKLILLRLCVLHKYINNSPIALMLHSAINVHDRSSLQQPITVLQWAHVQYSLCPSSIHLMRMFHGREQLQYVSMLKLRMFVFFLSVEYNKLVPYDLTNHLRHFTGAGRCFSF